MKGNQEGCEALTAAPGGTGGAGGTTRMHRRPGALAILVAAAALALAACSGGPSTPQVASLGTSTSSGGSTDPGTSSGTSGGSTPATQSASGPTRLVDEWAACERSHGDPGQADPTIDASGVIHITIPQQAQPTGDIHDLTGTCSEYLAAAQNELRAANPVAPPPGQSEYLKYVSCMRANGVPNYPYPTGDTTNFIGSGVDPDSPAVERVNQLCGKKIGAPSWWINGTDTPGSIEVHTAGTNPDPTAPACVFQKVNPCSGTVTVPASSGGPGTSFGSGTNG
jgi:hypothetical protein